jgi:hypothetical protein
VRRFSARAFGLWTDFGPVDSGPSALVPSKRTADGPCGVRRRWTGR